MSLDLPLSSPPLSVLHLSRSRLSPVGLSTIKNQDPTGTKPKVRPSSDGVEGAGPKTGVKKRREILLLTCKLTSICIGKPFLLPNNIVKLMVASLIIILYLVRFELNVAWPLIQEALQKGGTIESGVIKLDEKQTWFDCGTFVHLDATAVLGMTTL
ncbi:hypothetical protein ACFE04_028210 [Oxalis oulophora]